MSWDQYNRNRARGSDWLELLTLSALVIGGAYLLLEWILKPLFPECFN